MFESLIVGIAAAALLVALWETVLLIRNRLMDNPTFWALAVVEAALVVLTVTGFVLLAQPHRAFSTVIFVLYLIVTPLILPVGVIWAVGEKTRAGTGVLLVATVSIAVLMLRIHMLWVG